jgi:DTW domain-containing protein YfiP
MVVDTAKLLLSTFPNKSRLVVGGIGREHQPSMGEMLDAVRGGNSGDSKCLVLFPSEEAQTFDEIEAKEEAKAIHVEADDCASSSSQYDVVVIDGTWAQARKMYNRYIPSVEDGGPRRVQLSDDAVRTLNGENYSVEDYWYDNEQNQRISGHQLRRHPTKWREVATCEATRLLLQDMMADNFTTAAATTTTTDDENTIKPWDALARYQNIANAAALRQIGPPRIA